MTDRVYNLPLYTLLASLISLFINPAYAISPQTHGDYIIHYNAIPSTTIPPQIAKSYGIIRSKYRGMLNVTVMKKQDDGAPVPVIARISGQAKNLHNQLKPLELREIREQQAIYYIAEFGFNNGENLEFSLVVEPDNSTPYEINFENEFYTE